MWLLGALGALLLVASWRGADRADAAGVAAEGPPVLGPLIGPAQEREAIAQAIAQQHHPIRHQHHYGRHAAEPMAGHVPGPIQGLPADWQGQGQGQAHHGAHQGAHHDQQSAFHQGGHHQGDHHQGDHLGQAANSCNLSPEQLSGLVAKSLEGVCNEKEIGDRFHNLGVQLADQFNVLKTMILNLEEKVGAMDIGMERSERRLLAAIAKSKCSRGRAAALEDDADDDDAVLEQGGEDEDEVADYSDPPSPALGTTYRDGAQGVSAREEEIRRFNNTVHTELSDNAPSLGNSVAGCGLGSRVYTYYWRVRNMDYKLTGWNHRRSLRSPSFYVWPGGYRMYLRIYPRQSGENVYVHVGLTRGDHDNGLPWPFRLKHRLAVLDQVSAMTPPGPQDLVSRIWDPSQLCSGYNWQRPTTHAPDNYECVGLGFPQSVLRSRSYIRQDAAVVKLTVCLDQP